MVALLGGKKLRRVVRGIVQRSRHTGVLPNDNEVSTDLLRQILEEHQLKILGSQDGWIETEHWLGRRIEFKLKQKTGWHYRVTHDPWKRTARKKPTLFDEIDKVKPGDSEPCASSLWWDGDTAIGGKYIGFDLEAPLIEDGEFPPIVVMGVANEKGERLLVEPERIPDFFLNQHATYPTQIWTGWNIASFDIPALDFRIPGFRERVHDLLIRRMTQGYVLDAMLFNQLWDIGVYSRVWTKDSAVLFPWMKGWTGPYTLGAATKRWVGADISKEERFTFAEFVGHARAISEQQADYVTSDCLAAVAVMREMYENPHTWEVARKAKKQMTRLRGLQIQKDERVYSRLYREAGLEFGWQTHTIQFLGAYALAWVGLNGVEVDVDYTFDLLETMSDELTILYRRLAGQPGYSIYRIDKENTVEVAWVDRDPGEAVAKLEADNPGKTFKAGPRKALMFRNIYGHLGPDGDERSTLNFQGAPEAGKGSIFRFANPTTWKVQENDLRTYIAQYVLPNQPEELLNDLGLKRKAWLYHFKVDDVSDLPDPVLRLYFQAAEKRKEIGAVKTYIPGYLRLRKIIGKGAAGKLSLKELRARLNLVGVSRGRVYPAYKPLVSTGRTGAGEPNIQQVKRDSRFRGCFVAPEGWLLIGSDYGAIEMVTQAEIYIHRYNDHSMAKYLNDGYDLHFLTGMKIRFPKEQAKWMPILSDPDLRDMKRAVSQSEVDEIMVRLRKRFDWIDDVVDPKDSGEDIAKDAWTFLLMEAMLPQSIPAKQRKKTIKEARQGAKPFNFGVAGGMKPPRIQVLAKTDYRVDMTREEAEAAYRAGMEMHPVWKRWLRDGVQHLIPTPPLPYEPYYDNCFVLTGRLRGALFKGEAKGHDGGLNEWHNTQFQGLAADGAKLALYLGWREGLLLWSFIHDEENTESPEHLADEHTEILQGTMLTGMQRVVRDTNVTNGAKRLRRWKK